MLLGLSEWLSGRKFSDLVTSVTTGWKKKVCTSDISLLPKKGNLTCSTASPRNHQLPIDFAVLGLEVVTLNTYIEVFNESPVHSSLFVR
ncbi:hypothetical protein EYC84_011243 [Monilinia fructicola]|uniref:Uncharacterized protein n=1 Tax=Monilinia fructicola TaxID=38448 RepID=A0A5M9J8W8_MONFR|nr:hypothetical protein EYC84_011243 [Monilinia fructicola]